MRGLLTGLFITGMINLAFGQCLTPSAFEYLDVNNAKVGIRNGGGLWTDGEIGRYEIPAGSHKHSWYSGGFWIGGLDDNNALHVAATVYNNNGFDFYPGPLDQNGEVDPAMCADADRIFKLNRHEVDQFRLLYNQPSYTIPQDILEWPAAGNPFTTFHADAPFVDVNNDQVYNPMHGDYPAFSFDGSVDIDRALLGDQVLWWVMNDKGHDHTESGGAPLGLEIHCMAYAFSTCDELNDQTFYRYRIINKSNNNYHDARIGIYSDPDLGSADDDYAGCDVMRSVGYVYNGDAFDGTSGGEQNYPDNPPSAGLDILRGPLADGDDGIDNDRDGITDEPNEHLVMSNFSVHLRQGSAPPYGAIPSSPAGFYNYLNSIWLDGASLCYGGDGHPNGGGNSDVPANFMYPGNSDPQGFGTDMVPQAEWTETNSNNPIGDRKMLSGIGPFSMNSGETEILHFAALWAWNQFGPDPFSSVELMLDASDAVQTKFDNGFQNMGCCPPIAAISAQIFETYTYVFSPLSSGNSYFWDFGDGATSTDAYPIHEYAGDGNYEVCLTVSNDCGTETICEYATIAPAPLSVILKRIEGQGNGNRILDFTQDVHGQVLNASNHQIDHPTYHHNRGPVRIQVLDQSLVPSGEIAIRLNDLSQNGGWKMYVNGQPDTIFSNTTIYVGDEQLVTQWGLLVQIKQTGNWEFNTSNCVLDASLDFTGNTPWLSGLSDTDYPHFSNWIKSGTSQMANGFPDDFEGFDDEECFESVLGGKWAPYRLASNSIDSTANLPIAWDAFREMTKIRDLASVDLVITPDMSKWTRSPVIETGPHPNLNQGSRQSHELRDHVSIDKLGNPDGSGTHGMSWFPGYAINLETGQRLNIMFGENSSLIDDNGQDLIWNPSATVGSEAFPIIGGGHYIYIMGHNSNDVGRMPHYDQGQFIYNVLSADDFDPTYVEKAQVYRDAMWVTPPLLAEGHSLLESEVVVRLRVKKPYAQYETSQQPINNTNPLYNFNASDISSAISEEAESLSQLAVFPNPSNGQFTIAHPELTSLQIHAVDGRIVHSESGLNGSGQVGLNEPPGIYFIIAGTGNSKLVKKLVLR